MHRVRDILPLVTWVLTLAVAIVLFTALGSGPLAAPPLTSPSAWGEWASAREPVVATVALLRLLVLAMAWYLVGTTTVGAVARIAKLGSLVHVADALSVPVVRRVLQTSLGVGLATAVVASSGGTVATVRPATPATPAAAAGEATDEPRMRALDEPRLQDVPAMRALDDPTPEAPSMQVLDPTGPAPPGMRPQPTTDGTGATEDSPDPTPTMAPAPVREPGPTDDTGVHTVRPGDHLWQIAHDHLADRHGHPTDDEVADYWRRLIDANRDRLVDAGNPDLILPGQQFVLPSVEVAR